MWMVFSTLNWNPNKQYFLGSCNQFSEEKKIEKHAIYKYHLFKRAEIVICNVCNLTLNEVSYKNILNSDKHLKRTGEKTEGNICTKTYASDIYVEDNNDQSHEVDKLCR